MRLKKDVLTERQMMVQYEICRYFRENDRFPTHRELVAALHIQDSSLIHCLKRLREMKYIQKTPKARGYRILRWIENDVCIKIPLIGLLSNGYVVSSRRNPLAMVTLPSASVTCSQIDINELFALTDPQPHSGIVPDKSAIAIFRKRSMPCTGNTIIATLNGIQKLFRIKFSLKETLLLPEDGIPICLSPKDDFVIDAIKMLTFSNTKIEMN